MLPLHARCWLFALVIGAFLCGCTRREHVQAINFAGMVTAEETVSKTFKTGANPKVTFDTFNGSIDVVAGAEGLVEVVVTKQAGGKTKAEAEEALKELAVNFTEEMDGICIAVVAPVGKLFTGGASAKVKVPAATSLDLKTSLGRVTVAGINGNIRAASSQGPISIKDARGLLDLHTNLAGIDVDASSSNVTARNSQGAIRIRGATGTLDLVTNLANIDVDAPCTDVKAKNSQGAITIRGATGALALTTNIAPIDVDARCSSVTASNSQGAITVKGAKGPLKLTTSLATIVASADGAEVEAANSQGSIKIQGAKGLVKARTSLGTIDIHARDAVVDATNSQGGVTFSGSLAAGKHSFRTTLGNALLTLPADAVFHIDAQVSLGRIKNAFTLKHMEKSSDTRLSGSVGDNPVADVHMNVSQGSVEIKKAE